MPTDSDIAGHYARDGLEASIRDALRKSGLDPDHLAPADLSPVDEFHIGWRPATEALLANLGLAADMRVLDIGAGLGGPARHVADASGCRVTGIDRTPDYVAVANTLSEWCGLADRVTIRQGSALDLPFDHAAFDVVTMIHVGMNIADKARLFTEMRRVVKTGGRVGIYDIMRVGAGDPAYPAPWAASAATSFLDTPAAYMAGLVAAGFEIESETDRTQLAQEMARRAREAVERDGLPPLGLHLVMGDERPKRIGNMMAAVADGIIAPIEIIARAA
ncbi:MAG: methyltransferase domain-containing protein [Alphaproteobacteria bacterium]